eukprot:471732-Prymnesium_polylepis.1
MVDGSSPAAARSRHSSEISGEGSSWQRKKLTSWSAHRQYPCGRWAVESVPKRHKMHNIIGQIGCVWKQQITREDQRAAQRTALSNRVPDTIA